MWFFQQSLTTFIESWAILKGVQLFHYKLLTVVMLMIDMQIAFITLPALFSMELVDWSNIFFGTCSFHSMEKKNHHLHYVNITSSSIVSVYII